MEVFLLVEAMIMLSGYGMSVLGNVFRFYRVMPAWFGLLPLVPIVLCSPVEAMTNLSTYGKSTLVIISTSYVVIIAGYGLLLLDQIAQCLLAEAMMEQLSSGMFRKESI